MASPRSSESSESSHSSSSLSSYTPEDNRHRVLTELLLNDDVDPAGLRRLADAIYEEDFKTPHYYDIVKILDAVKPLFEKESSLVEVGLPVAIFGDSHGSPEFIGLLNELDKSDHPDRTRIFLGNYLGEVFLNPLGLMYLFVLKCLHPDKIILLRGNFEQRLSLGGVRLGMHLLQQFDGWMADDLAEKIKVVLEHLPLACLINGRSLCMHGGISEKLTSLDAIRKIPKPLKYPDEHELAHALLNANPMWNLKGFKTTETQVYFGQDVLKKTLKKLNLQMIIRGNEIMPYGSGFFPDMSCATLVSVTNFDDEKENFGAVMMIDANNAMYFTILAPPDISEKWSTSVPVQPRGDHAVNKTGEANYVFNDIPVPDLNLHFARSNMEGNYAIPLG